MEEANRIISLLEQLVKGQQRINETLEDVLNLFKKYDIEELMDSENLREG